MDSEIQNPVSRGDWTLFVRSKVPADCMNWPQCDLLDQVDWEEMGTYQSKQFDIDFPYYRNKEKKIIVVKVLDESPKDPVRLNRAIQELSASLSIKKILYTVNPS